MKDILLKITGKDMGGKDPVEELQLITEGKLYQRGNTTMIKYDESSISGIEGCTATLTIKKDKVSLRRSGAIISADTIMDFERGRRCDSFYFTPYGPIPIELLTNRITEPVEKDGSTSFSIDYRLSLGGVARGRKILDIEYRDKN